MRLAELAAALSLAGDLGSGLALETTLRTTRIGLGLARAHGLGNPELGDTFWAGLLRHAGCTSNAQRARDLAIDDLALKKTLAFADTGRPRDVLGRVTRGFAPEARGLTRAKVIAKFLVHGQREARTAMAEHCEVGIRFARRLGMGDGVTRALDHFDERWDGKGVPRGVRGADIVPVARVLMIGEVASLFAGAGGAAAAVEAIEGRAGTQLDPAMARTFLEHADALLVAASSTAVWDELLAEEPRPWRTESASGIDELCAVLADFADLKSPYLHGHSRHVSAVAGAAAERLGLGGDVRTLRLAGLVHDLGRVAVSTAVWDKPGPLGSGEWERVRTHPYHTERVLARAPQLAPIGRLGASDHERLDGSGYFRGAAPSTTCRVLAAADVYVALIEDRPHRAAHTPARAAELLRAEVAAGRLDHEAVEAVLGATGHAPATRAAWPAGLTDREVDVLRLVVKGLTNKEIAAQLAISARTVQTHTLHVYQKIGCTTRGAAALFAIENDLVRRRA